MNILEFAARVETAQDDEAVERWVSRLREALAEQTFFFARYADHVDKDLREDYIRLLERILTELPEDAPRVVSASLFNYLEHLLPAEHHDDLQTKVRPSSRIPA